MLGKYPLGYRIVRKSENPIQFFRREFLTVVKE